MTTATYDPITYWTERGKTYRRDLLAFMDQERAFEGVLADINEDYVPLSILEVGCGFGRMTRYLYERFVDSHIAAIDISHEQIKQARRRLPDVDFMALNYRRLIDPSADLVVAAEVLMHQPPDRVWDDVEHLLSLAKRYLVHVDWWQKHPRIRSPHCWMYNFARYYAGNGYACRTIDIPTAKQRIYVVDKGA